MSQSPLRTVIVVKVKTEVEKDSSGSHNHLPTDNDFLKEETCSSSDDNQEDSGELCETGTELKPKETMPNSVIIQEEHCKEEHFTGCKFVNTRAQETSRRNDP